MNARYLAAASAVLLALGGAGSAAAGSSQGSRLSQSQASGDDAFVGVEVAYLGIDKQTLVGKLKEGQSLAQIATAQGKSPQGLIDALVTASKKQLDAKVKTGKLSKAKAATVLAKLRPQVVKLVGKSFGPNAKIPAVYLKAILGYLQIGDQTLQQELNAGKSLGQIAVAHGKTAAGLTAAILVPIQQQLDTEVTAGKLTAPDRDALFAQAQSNVAKLVAGTA
jgi:hypothetical protein